MKPPMELVARLCEAGLTTRRFLKVKPRDKAAIELDWPDKLYEPEELEGWEGNYGVCAGEGLVLVDADEDPLLSRLREELPETFTVLSPGHKAPHYYLHVIDAPENLTLYWGKDDRGQPKNVGHVQSRRKFLIGPGSIHPNGLPYTILFDAPIAPVAWDELRSFLAPFLLNAQRAIAREHSTLRRRAEFNLDIMAILPAGLKEQGGEFYGPHPVHGSITGRNFWVNPKDGTWYCFRCGSGGDSWYLLAVLEGIIDCRDARPGVLRGDLFRQTLEKAQERGLIESPRERERFLKEVENL